MFSLTKMKLCCIYRSANKYRTSCFVLTRVCFATYSLKFPTNTNDISHWSNGDTRNMKVIVPSIRNAVERGHIFNMFLTGIIEIAWLFYFLLSVRKAFTWQEWVECNFLSKAHSIILERFSQWLFTILFLRSVL